MDLPIQAYGSTVTVGKLYFFKTGCPIGVENHIHVCIFKDNRIFLFATANEEKAKEVLMDIGYFRLGFYLFPFEKSYPKLRGRKHEYKEGPKLNDAVTLYYYDFDLRNILLRYIIRIEVTFRTYMIYELSNKYKNEPTWFISPQIVSQSFIQSFDNEIYNDNFRKNSVIQRHHRKYINDRYAPAWKTIEFMTLGNVLKLYQNLKDIDDKRIICKHFGINQTAVFENYMETIRVIRNKCAHGSTLFDLSLCQSIKNGPAGRFPIGDAQGLSSAINVILYMIGTISQNRKKDLLSDLSALYKKAIDKNPEIEWVIKNLKKSIYNLQ